MIEEERIEWTPEEIESVMQQRSPTEKALMEVRVATLELLEAVFTSLGLLPSPEEDE